MTGFYYCPHCQERIGAEEIACQKCGWVDSKAIRRNTLVVFSSFAHALAFGILGLFVAARVTFLRELWQISAFVAGGFVIITIALFIWAEVKAREIRMFHLIPLEDQMSSPYPRRLLSKSAEFPLWVKHASLGLSIFFTATIGTATLLTGIPLPFLCFAVAALLAGLSIYRGKP